MSRFYENNRLCPLKDDYDKGTYRFNTCLGTCLTVCGIIEQLCSKCQSRRKVWPKIFEEGLKICLENILLVCSECYYVTVLHTALAFWSENADTPSELFVEELTCAVGRL